MRIDIDVTMDYQLVGSETVLLALEAARTEGQTVVESALKVEQATLHPIEGEGVVGRMAWACVTGDRLKLHYSAKVDVDRLAVDLETIAPTPLHALPGDVVTYLRPSRFCQSDLFIALVEQQFGHLAGGAKIAAIARWIGAEIAYVPGSSDSATTAVDTFVARRGVCRDYAHLVCALARAANIPARYTSVYGLGVNPPDFHAVAQVWLGGEWHLIDATNMATPDGMVVIAAGRDAGDVAFMETEQWAQVSYQQIDVRQA